MTADLIIRRMERLSRVGAVITSASLVAAACGGGAVPSPSSPGASPVPGASGTTPSSGVLDGPLRSLGAGLTVDRMTGLNDRRYTFSADDPQIAVLAVVGDLPEPTRLIVSWRAGIEPSGPELFRHEIEVATRERAYSIGLSQGELATGRYVVSAQVGDSALVLPIRVDASDDVAGPAPGAAPPGSGDSGTFPPPEAPRSLDLGYGEPDGVASSVDFTVFGGTPFVVEASIGGGPLETLATLDAPGESGTDFWFDPCTLVNGSDLPGTVASVRVQSADGSDSASGMIDLGPDDLAPDLLLTSSPGAGTSVEAGDTITFELEASEVRSGVEVAAPFQTGVSQITLLESPPLSAGYIAEYSEGETPMACGAKVWTAGASATYTVPENPPPTLTFVATASDFDGNLTELLVSFPTTDERSWTGIAPTMRSEVVYSGGVARCEDAWRMDFTFVEADDGTVLGQGTADLVTDWICEPDFPGARSPSQHFTYTLAGERDGDAFTLELLHQSGTAGVGMAAMWHSLTLPASVTIPVSGDRGSVDALWTWSFQNPDGSAVNYTTDGQITICTPQCPVGVG